MKKLISLFFLSILYNGIYSQNLNTKNLSWRNIGPANMMGRIAAIDASNKDYRKVLIASASGGVFKSDNAGVTWESIFDKYGAGSIGSVKFDQNNLNTICSTGVIGETLIGSAEDHGGLCKGRATAAHCPSARAS